MNVKRIFPLIALAALMSQAVQARELKALGISMGSLGNPYFVTLADGATARAKALNPNVKVTSVSADYDLSKQFSQIDNFISSKVDLILINAVDPSAMASAIKKARDAGIVVVAVDVDAKGVNATVQRVACGAADTVPYLTVTNLARTLRALKERGVWVVGTDDEAEKSIHDIDAAQPIAWVLGAEGEGMRRLTRETCDELVNIPMMGSIESLNVSVASAVCMYETVRQRAAKKAAK